MTFHEMVVSCLLPRDTIKQLADIAQEAGGKVVIVDPDSEMGLMVMWESWTGIPRSKCYLLLLRRTRLPLQCAPLFIRCLPPRDCYTPAAAFRYLQC